MSKSRPKSPTSKDTKQEKSDLESAPVLPITVDPQFPQTGPSDAIVDSRNDSGLERLYRGASGQMAVLSEFLYRLINVAVPEVDIGDDIFVVQESDDAVTRVQVKYAAAKCQKNKSLVAQFDLPWEQFDRSDDNPALVYVLAIRSNGRWTDFVVIRRSVLRQLHADEGIGSVAKDKHGAPQSLRLRLVFTSDDLKASKIHSLKQFRNAFDPWPPPQVASH